MEEGKERMRVDENCLFARLLESERNVSKSAKLMDTFVKYRLIVELHEYRRAFP